MTKPSYEELQTTMQSVLDSWRDDVAKLESGLARVRGLLQRHGSHTPNCESEYFKVGCACGWDKVSADIGKLGAADKKGDRCDYQSVVWRCTLPPNHSGGHSPFMDDFAGGETCPDCPHSLYHHVTEGCAYTVAKDGKTEQCNCGRPRPDYIEKESARVAALPMEERCKAGSAETGGEKAEFFAIMECADGLYLCLGDKFVLDKFPKDNLGRQRCVSMKDDYEKAINDMLPNFPRPSQNQTVSSGVEGAHEGTTADKSGWCECGHAEEDHSADGCMVSDQFPDSGCECKKFKYVALAESSLSSPPPPDK